MEEVRCRYFSIGIIIVAIAAAFLFVILYYSVLGPGWDLIVHMLNAETMLKHSFYMCMLNGCGVYNGTQTFYYSSYFEPERAPMSSLAIIPLYIILGKNCLLAYELIVLAAYLSSIYYLAKSFKVRQVFAYISLATPYFAFFLSFNGAELLSLVFISFGLSLLYKRSTYSGIFFGLAFVSKYTTIIFAPMLLLLMKPRKILASSGLAFIPSLAWILFQALFMHSPLASYSLSFILAKYNSSFLGLNLASLAIVAAYPLLLISLALAFNMEAIKGLIAQLCSGFKKNLWLILRLAKARVETTSSIYLLLIICAFLILAIADYLFLSNTEALVQARLGYTLSFALGLVALFLLSLEEAQKTCLLIKFSSISFLFLLMLYGVYFATSSSHDLSYSVKNPAVVQAKSELYSLGYENCRIISNNWVYLLYVGVDAFPQYYPNSTNLLYPIVVFYNSSALTSPASIVNLSSSNPIFKSRNFSILLPENYKCYK
ncbi:MAG: hypothetical protein ACP5RP_01870 [Candidatus Micrarchaeia archaeon]